MTLYRGTPFSPVESQMDLVKSHVTRPTIREPRTDGERTMTLAVPAGWTREAKCIGSFDLFDISVGLRAGEAMSRCEGCPVIEECLSAALAEEGDLSAGNRYGIRGGLSPKERALVALADRECSRGHRNRWSNTGTVLICLECKSEDGRKRWKRIAETDPEYMARRVAKMRESRDLRRVSCLECKATLQAKSFQRHLDTVHREGRAA